MTAALRVQARCTGCDWHVSVTTLAQLRDAAMRHDDSPRTGHIVHLHPPGPWPEDDRAFADLAAPDPVGDLVDQVAALTAALDRLERTLLDPPAAPQMLPVQSVADKLAALAPPTPPAMLCGSCGAPVNPATSECRCS